MPLPLAWLLALFAVRLDGCGCLMSLRMGVAAGCHSNVCLYSVFQEAVRLVAVSGTKTRTASSAGNVSLPVLGEAGAAGVRQAAW